MYNVVQLDTQILNVVSNRVFPVKSTYRLCINDLVDSNHLCVKGNWNWICNLHTLCGGRVKMLNQLQHGWERRKSFVLVRMRVKHFMWRALEMLSQLQQSWERRISFVLVRMDMRTIGTYSSDPMSKKYWELDQKQIVGQDGTITDQVQQFQRASFSVVYKTETG